MMDDKRGCRKISDLVTMIRVVLWRLVGCLCNRMCGQTKSSVFGVQYQSARLTAASRLAYNSHS